MNVEMITSSSSKEHKLTSSDSAPELTTEANENSSLFLSDLLNKY